MRKNFFFMTLNIILLPLTGFTALNKFLETFKQNVETWTFFSFLSAKMGTIGNYFLGYMMGICFISNGMLLLDIPHNINKGIRYLFRKFKNEPFKDTWFVDIGSYSAYSATIFMLCLMFSAVMPLINIFGFIFFTLKYFTFKYHFIYVY
jgi:hypothetical protein